MKIQSSKDLPVQASGIKRGELTEINKSLFKFSGKFRGDKYSQFMQKPLYEVLKKFKVDEFSDAVVKVVAPKIPKSAEGMKRLEDMTGDELLATAIEMDIENPETFSDEELIALINKEIESIDITDPPAEVDAEKQKRIEELVRMPKDDLIGMAIKLPASEGKDLTKLNKTQIAEIIEG